MAFIFMVLLNDSFSKFICLLPVIQHSRISINTAVISTIHAFFQGILQQCVFFFDFIADIHWHQPNYIPANFQRRSSADSYDPLNI
jgi:hypothetical protein